MPVEVGLLLIILLALTAYVGFKWRYRYTCPQCKGRARKGKVEVGYQMVRGGRKKSVRGAVGLCALCGNIWLLSDVRCKTSGLIIPKETELHK